MNYRNYHELNIMRDWHRPISRNVFSSVTFYFTVESEPSLDIIARSLFILPSSQNRHSTSLAEWSISTPNKIIHPFLSKNKMLFMFSILTTLLPFYPCLSGDRLLFRSSRQATYTGIRLLRYIFPG